MSVKIISDGENRIVIGRLGQIPSRLLSSLIITFKTLCRDVAADATAHHRFTSRSGNLERSIQSGAKEAAGDVVGEVFLRDQVADYGKYVHQGHGSWKPDKFIESAFARSEAKIDAAITRAIDKEMGI